MVFDGSFFGGSHADDGARHISFAMPVWVMELFVRLLFLRRRSTSMQVYGLELIASENFTSKAVCARSHAWRCLTWQVETSVTRRDNAPIISFVS